MENTFARILALNTAQIFEQECHDTQELNAFSYIGELAWTDYKANIAIFVIQTVLVA